MLNQNEKSKILGRWRAFKEPQSLDEANVLLALAKQDVEALLDHINEIKEHLEEHLELISAPGLSMQALVLRDKIQRLFEAV